MTHDEILLKETVAKLEKETEFNILLRSRVSTLISSVRMIMEEKHKLQSENLDLRNNTYEKYDVDIHNLNLKISRLEDDIILKDKLISKLIE